MPTNISFVEFRDGKIVNRNARFSGGPASLEMDMPSMDKSSMDKPSMDDPRVVTQKAYYREATRICPEARKSQPDPEVLARQMKIGSFHFKGISAEEGLDILKMGREQGWPSGDDEVGANLALSTGKLVKRSDVKFLYESELDDHPELAEAEWNNPQLAMKIKADSIFFDDFTVTEVIDILKLGRELAEQAK